MSDKNWRLSIFVTHIQCERARWHLDLARQPAVDTVLNTRPDLAPVLVAMTQDPQTPFIGVLGMAHYRNLTWAECREHHLRTLTEMRRVRHAASVIRYAEDSAVDAGARLRDGDRLELQWLDYGPSLLARFPTRSSIEELALILESLPKVAEFSADALSVCLTPAATPRVRAALYTALEKQDRMEKESGLKPENDFARLKTKLANPSANLINMPDVMGVRFVIPDPEAAAVNDLPVPAPSPATVAAVTAPTAGGQGWSWWWLLLLLVPVTAWAALGRKKR